PDVDAAGRIEQAEQQRSSVVSRGVRFSTARCIDELVGPATQRRMTVDSGTGNARRPEEDGGSISGPYREVVVGRVDRQPRRDPPLEIDDPDVHVAAFASEVDPR